MGIIEGLNANSGAVIGIATVVLVGITGIYVYLTWRLLKANNTPEIAISLHPHFKKKSRIRKQKRFPIHDKNEVKSMAATVYIYANDHLSFEIPGQLPKSKDLGLCEAHAERPLHELNSFLQSYIAVSVRGSISNVSDTPLV